MLARKCANVKRYRDRKKAAINPVTVSIDIIRH